MAILTISAVVLFFRMLLRSYPLLASSQWSVSSSISVSDRDERVKTYNSLKKINDDTLIRELQHRGYDITSPREHETTPEIQKIAI